MIFTVTISMAITVILPMSGSSFGVSGFVVVSFFTVVFAVIVAVVMEIAIVAVPVGVWALEIRAA